MTLAAVLIAAAGAAAAPVPVEHFARHAEFSNVKISPGGQFLAATSEAGNKTVLVLLNRDDLKSGTVLSVPANNHVYWFEWATDERVLYKFEERKGAYDFPRRYGQIYASDADGTDHKPIFGYIGEEQTGATRIRANKMERASGQVIDMLPDDPRHVLIAQWPWTQEANRFLTVEKLDIERGVRTKIERLPVRNASTVCDGEGQPRFAYGFDEDYRWRVMYRPQVGKDWTGMSALSDAGFAPLAYEPDGIGVLGRCPNERSVQSLCRFDTDTGSLETILSHDTFDVSGTIYDPVTRRIVGVFSQADIPQVEITDANSTFAANYRKLLGTFEGQVVSVTSATSDGAMMVVHVRSDRNPGDFYLFDAKTLNAQYLVSERAWIDPEEMGTMEPVVFEARDGTTIHGYVTYPPGGQRKDLPMVVLPHGGPHGVRDAWRFDSEVQFLASRGYAVLQPNFRGSGGYGQNFEEAGYREWGRTMQDDVTDATLWAIEQGIADRNRVCIYGGSYGGYAALMGVAREPDLYRCAIGSAGVYDLELMYTRGDIRSWMSGKAYLEKVLTDDATFLRSRSPINYASQIRVPVMLIHGGKDERVPPVHARNMRKALKREGNAPEWLYFNREAHGYYDEDNRAKMFRRIEAFLGQHIGEDRPHSAAGR